jgi:glycine/D-amino acid oxidase-like deaminating enzyme
MLPNRQDASGFARSLWRASAGALPDAPAFEGEQTADVAIVGAGITGLSAALALGARGVRPVVLEADAIGAGASGRNGGFIVPNFSRIDPDGVCARLGEAGEALLDLLGRAGEAVFRAIVDHGIDCDAAQAGWLQPAHSPAALALIERRCRQWQDRGRPVSLHDAAETERLTGCRGYLGSWMDPSGGTIHPLEFVHGLAGAASHAGATIYAASPVRSLERRADRSLLHLARGTLQAERVLICANALTGGLLPPLDRAVLPLAICQMATRPVAKRDRGHLFADGKCLSDTRINLFTYRFDRDWRLITGSMAISNAFGAGPLARLMARRLERMLSLPQVPEIEYAWTGLASITADGLPKLYEIAPGVLAATACNGRGLAMSFQMGRVLAEAALSPSFEGLPLPVERAHPFRHRALAAVAARAYPIYGLFKDRLA